MSHLGSRILYGLLNDQKGIWCERVCAPWIDMEAEMREAGLPLYGLESGDPLSDFDIIAFTLQYELSFSNILNMLDLGGIPVLAKDRTELKHIVACGGPCAYNPEPLADFVDLFMIGDGEEVMMEFLDAVKQAKKEETEVRKICRYMRTLSDAESRFEDALQTVDKIYRRHLEKLGDLVVLSGKTDWNDYSDAEKKLTENTALLVGLLYSMCKVQLVLQSNSATELNRVNEEEINASREAAKNFLADSGLSALV